MSIIRVDDHATREDLVEAVTSVNARAKRIPRVVGSKELPTEWDRRHEQLNLLITQLLATP